jgi:hypothetical protein
VSVHHLSDLIAAHGYIVVAAIVALESMGLPLPGETTLVTAAAYAGTTHRLDIGLVIAAAAAGAIVGDSAGFWIGRRFGHALVDPSAAGGIDDGQVKLGQYCSPGAAIRRLLRPIHRGIAGAAALLLPTSLHAVGPNSASTSPAASSGRRCSRGATCWARP